MTVCFLLRQKINHRNLHNGNSKMSKSKENLGKNAGNTCNSNVKYTWQSWQICWAWPVPQNWTKPWQRWATQDHYSQKITSSAIVFTEMFYRIPFPMCFLYYYAPKNSVSFQLSLHTSLIFHSSLNTVATQNLICSSLIVVQLQFNPLSSRT